MLPTDVGGATGQPGSFGPETNRLYIHRHTAVFSLVNVQRDLSMPGPANLTLQECCGAVRVRRVHRYPREGAAPTAEAVQPVPLAAIAVAVDCGAVQRCRACRSLSQRTTASQLTT
jgi:hypothetical protein